jgi:sugar transferase EpsL
VHLLSRGNIAVVLGVPDARSFKRAFDVVVSSVLLLVCWPVLAGIALAVRIKLGSPVFFRQERPGLHGRTFTLVKFRTMTAARDENGNVLDDGARLTRFGRWLRSTSLDELPELFNVLKGEMSLVGPRPLLLDYLPLYTPRQARRHEVRPGLTGWAQVNGRNELPWPQKFEMDVWYVDNWSFGLDLKIIALTVLKMICREGITEPGKATVEPFRGG